MAKSIWVLFGMLCASPPLHAEIFKCVGKGGADRFQNFPCHLDSIGSLQSNLPPKPPTAPVSPAKPMTPMATKAVAPSEPTAGMTQDDVRAIWGDPVETTEDSPSSGRIETWHYGDNRSVRFNPKRRVVSVRR